MQPIHGPRSDMIFSPLHLSLFPDLAASEPKEAGEEVEEGRKFISFEATDNPT